MFRKALLVLSGNATTSLLGLMRNLLIARLLPVEDYGIASTFALAMSVIEMASALGLQQQLIQSKNGDDPDFQAALQGFQVLRGVMNATILFLLAGPIADFMNVPEATWGYQFMALVPILNSFGHFDGARRSRNMNFGPSIFSGVITSTLSLLATYPLVLWLGDWRAMLGVILLNSIMGLVSSHLIAKRSYRLRLDRIVMQNSLRFGWPILINGVLLFLVFNGDRVIVGRELGMAALGIFSMGMTLTLTPTLVLGATVQGFFLPRLSRIDRSTPEGHADMIRMSTLATEAVFSTCMAFLLGTLILAGPAVQLILGERYVALIPLMGLFAVVQVVRVAKAVPSVVALSVGRPGNAAAANLVRVASLPVAWLALRWSSEVSTVLWVALVSETLGYVVATILALRSAPGLLWATAWPHVGFVACIAVTLAVVALRSPEEVMAFPSLSMTAGLLVTFAITTWSLRTLRNYAVRLWS